MLQQFTVTYFMRKSYTRIYFSTSESQGLVWYKQNLTTKCWKLRHKSDKIKRKIHNCSFNNAVWITTVLRKTVMLQVTYVRKTIWWV